jgi:RNA polymerase sigma factor (sigma-70 family)
MAASLDTAYANYSTSPDPSSLEALLGSVRAYALRRARRCANLDADDIAQQVTIAVWQGLSSYTGTAHIKTWVTSIINNKVRDAHRIRYSTPHIEQMEFHELDMQPCLDAAPPGINLTGIICGEYTSAERELMRKLSEGTETECIAADLGISPAAVRNRLKRLRRKIVRQSDTIEPRFTTN